MSSSWVSLTKMGGADIAFHQGVRFSSFLRFQIVWLTLCGLSLGNPSDNTYINTRSDLLMSSISDAVRNGATVVSRFLNPETSTFLPFVFQKLSERVKKLDKMSGEESKEEDNELILIMLRLMGVDSKKVSDFAFNGVISLVLLSITRLTNRDTIRAYILSHIRHLVIFGTVFTEQMRQVLLKDEGRRRRQRETSRNFSLFRFVLSQPQVVNLLNQAQNPNLVDLILNESKTKLKSNPEEDVECIGLLLCWMKPFVRGMQRSLRFFLKREEMEISDEKFFDGRAPEETCSQGEEDIAWERASLEGRMYFFAPTMKEVVVSGQQCDQLFPDCLY